MDIFSFLQKHLLKTPEVVSQVQMKAAQGSIEQADMLKRFGIVTDDLRAALSNSDMINFERSSLYTSIDRSLVHPIMSGAAGIYSDVACLTANTEIPLLDGRVLTIEKLLCEYNEGKENWVYSCDTKGSPKAEKINWVVKQPNKKETLRVHLDNGKFIEASTNHEFIKRTGELCRTDELKVNDSLLPFHRVYRDSNSKIVKIENIGEQEVYDLNINGSHLFALDCGVYVHNSSYNRVHNATVWVTAKNKEYQYQIEKLFEIVNLEENIYDLCWSTATFGDLFWRIFAEPGLGVVSIDDTAHPITTCLRGSTKINLFDNSTPTIQEMFENRNKYIGKDIYCCSESGGIRATQIKDVLKTRLNATYVRVHLDSGEYFDCTPDHKCMLRTGKFKEAKDLKPFESLMPLKNNGVLLNHKVDRIEYLDVIEDAYDLTVAGVNPTFPLSCGVFVHNSRIDYNGKLIGFFQTPGGYCLSGDTVINLMDRSTPTIKEMADNREKYIGKRIWSINPTTKLLEIDEISEVQKTRINAELVRVILDDSTHIDTTPDHKFMLRTGEFREAKDLKENDSLMPHHKVLRVEVLIERKDTYDLTTVKNHNFPIGSGVFVHNSSQADRKLEAPWDYVHFRLLGQKRRRPQYGASDSNFSEYRTVSIMAPDVRRLTSKYGTCLPSTARVHLKNGTLAIGDIVNCKLNVEVKTLNESTGEIEYKKVIGFKSRENHEPLVLIGYASGYRRRSLSATSNHPIATPNGWIPIGNIKVGDYILVESPTLSKDQEQIILGTMLGDAHFKSLKNKGGYNLSSYTFGQSKYITYFNWIKDNLKNLNMRYGVRSSGSRKNSFKSERHLGKKLNFKDHHFVQSKALPVLESLYALCCVNGKKKVTRELLDKIEPLGLATWFMDDGSVQYISKNKENVSCIICTDSFSLKENKIIAKWFKEKYGIIVNIKKTGGVVKGVDQHRIYFPVGACKKLREIISPYLVFDLSAKSSKNRKSWISESIEQGKEDGVIPVKVTTKGIVNHKGNVFDIEIDGNHNFLVGEDAGIVVHNSVLSDALPIFKRLRLAEDSVLMARITRGVLRYMYKIGIDKSNSNNEAVGSLIDSYVSTLKEARCVRGNTQIALLNGTNPTIQEMAENKNEYIGKSVYSVNPLTKAIEPDKIINVAKTLVNTNIIRVHLDNDLYVDCTPDHRFMMRDAAFKEAQYLVSGDSLMPLYTKITKGRTKVLNPKTSKFTFVYRVVSECINGKTPDGYVVHHEDENKLNDDPFNLKVVTKEYHQTICHPFIKKIVVKHGKKDPWNKGLTKETDPRVAQLAESVKETQRVKKELGFGLPAWNRGLTVENNESVKKYTEARVGKKLSEEACANMVTGNKNRVVSKRIEREIRLCACGCGETFECKINSKRKYSKAGHSRRGKTNSIEHNEALRKFSTGRRFTHTQETKDTIGVCSKEMWAKRKGLVLNHKVFRIEWLEEKVDTYDITTEKNHNFALTNGIFVHNSLNIDTNNPSYNSKFSAMANIEDIIIPVWGDVNQVDVEKLGGEVDIKWIEDILLLTKQLSTALAIPLPLLAGYAQEANGGIGQNSLEKLDIRFARQARRVQRAVISGLTRLAQIHLAYQGINPDPNFFTIHMSETSTAEELELQDALDKGLDVTGKAMDMFERVLGPDLDKIAAMEYLNEKFLKLSDLELDKIMLKGNPNAFSVPAGEDTLGGGGSTGGSSSFGSAPATGSDSGNPFAEHATTGEDVAGSTEEPSTKPEEGEPNKGDESGTEDKEEENPFHENLNISDLHSLTPLLESRKSWEETWGKTVVKITPTKK